MPRSLIGAIVFVAVMCFAHIAAAQAAVVQIIPLEDGGRQLFLAGQPYFIKGAGGDASKQLLKDSGGNSFRTWDPDGLDAKLIEAKQLGLTVTVGIWLQHESSGWKYSDAAKVQKQLESAEHIILKYKDDPAVLMWGIGNEMEGYGAGDNPLIWNAVQDIAKFAHQNDPNHPTMTVIAEIGGKKVPSIMKYCPDIDVVGINSYGGGPTLAGRYRKAGGTKPFVVTEFGPPGAWESGKNAWGAPHELTSTEKGAYYRKTYEGTIAADRGKLCLGSYALVWGSKREATATWFGMLLPDGSRLEAVDQMQSLWTEQALVSRCPQIQPLNASADQAKPGETIHVTLDVTDPQDQPHRPMTVKWVLERDPARYITNGESQHAPRTFNDAITNGDLHGCDVKMPADVGGYWLYAYVTDGKGNSVVANISLLARG